ncbi:hypothetical protein D6810_02195 [Candidatus Dojkabacteria bacterium]|uniref:Uncharacterized protein n=1 Tax=Candidatus Dojkabacteria bacterium TaxID=2099670 RepID=A0A3M0Z1X4_9BACT|nr:MAG: hypothetical protein D6810_02195 [Candidatus Dojkabacteria bacterium]
MANLRFARSRSSESHSYSYYSSQYILNLIGEFGQRPIKPIIRTIVDVLFPDPITETPEQEVKNLIVKRIAELRKRKSDLEEKLLENLTNHDHNSQHRLNRRKQKLRLSKNLQSDLLSLVQDIGIAGLLTLNYSHINAVRALGREISRLAGYLLNNIRMYKIEHNLELEPRIASDLQEIEKMYGYVW